MRLYLVVVLAPVYGAGGGPPVAHADGRRSGWSGLNCDSTTAVTFRSVAGSGGVVYCGPAGPSQSSGPPHHHSSLLTAGSLHKVLHSIQIYTQYSIISAWPCFILSAAFTSLPDSPLMEPTSQAKKQIRDYMLNQILQILA